MHRLRAACAGRAGAGEAFERAVSEMSRIGRGLGESPASAPWFMDDSAKRPIEAAHLSTARNYQTWLKSLITRDLACTSLALSTNRCRACRALPAGSHYDCAQLFELETDLQARSRQSMLGALLVLGAGLLISW